MNGEEWFALAGDMGNIHIVAEKDAKDWHNYSRERRIETTLFYLDDERGGNKIAETICVIRNNIIPLLDEIERLQGEVERLKKEIDFAYKPL